MNRKKSDAVDDFDEYAKNYRDVHSPNIKISGADSLYFAKYKIKYLLEFEQNEPLKILDIGCGDGAVEGFIHQYFPQWKTTGIDVSAESLKIAETKNIPNTEFKVFDGTMLPFEADTFDVVFIASVLHHIKFDKMMKTTKMKFQSSEKNF